MSEIFHTHILPNGLRIIHRPAASKVGYCGLAVNAGSRDELDSQFGMAHFVEHTIFKGTTNRKSWHILNRMELVGGELNAYTSKEETFIYSIFPCEHYGRAIDLLGDLVQNSIFPGEEIEKEREVVLDEIDSYRDMPSEAVYDDFEDYLFAGSGLGHNILGTEKCLENIGSADLMNFLKNLYVPSNMVFFSCGNIKFDKLCKLADKAFGNMSHQLNRKPRIVPVQDNKFTKVFDLENHQSHTLYGSRIFGMYDERKYELALLNNMLAGPGMNSLLNVALREKRGYVYTVESNTTLYSDTGLFSIYFGCDKEHTAPCLRIIRNTLNNLAQNKMTATKLDAVKRQYIGQMLVSFENKENSAIALGKNMLYFNKVSTYEEISERIKAVTADQMLEVARLIAPENSSRITFD